jgi:transcriptional regulator with XRE-family HTH domain
MRKTKNLKDLGSLFYSKENTPGKIIKAFRSNFGITQMELAETTGISEKNISAIENDRREVGVLTAKRIAAFFGIDPAIILFPNGRDELINEYKTIHARGSLLIKEKQKAYREIKRKS